MIVHSLLDESQVQYLQCWWGNGLALGFKGDPAAIERCYNWAVNTGVTRGRLLWLYDRESIGYVYTNHDDLMKGLLAQFRADVIMGREVPLLRDEENEETGEVTIEYDEGAIDALVQARVTLFIAERLINENFMSSMSDSLAPIYGYGHLARTERAAD